MDILFETSNNQTNNLAVLLPTMVGMPVRITQNIAVDLGVENGTEGTWAGKCATKCSVWNAWYQNIVANCLLCSPLHQRRGNHGENVLHSVAVPGQ